MSDRLDRLSQPPDPDLVATLTGLVERVVSGLDDGRDGAAEIAEINRLSGGQAFEAGDFFELYGRMSSEDFAQIAAKGVPPAVSDLPRDELIEIIETIERGIEPNVQFFMDLLNRSLPSVWNSDLVFWPDVERTPQELADYLLANAGDVT